MIAATHRDLEAAIEAGELRSDFFYRLCADTITTPSLAEQLQQAPDDLYAFVEHIVDNLVGPDHEGEDETASPAALVEEIVAFIGRRLGPEYAWPGNVRELEQSVRSFVVKHDYTPRRVRAPRAGATQDARAVVQAALGELDVSANTLLDDYCAALYARSGNLAEVAKTTPAAGHPRN